MILRQPAANLRLIRSAVLGHVGERLADREVRRRLHPAEAAERRVRTRRLVPPGLRKQSVRGWQAHRQQHPDEARPAADRRQPPPGPRGAHLPPEQFILK
jgi:hypothetical protein